VNIFPDEWLLIKENVKHFSPSSGDKCTFLKDNECTIYDIRPVACRNHVVVSPPELCMANSNVENIGDIRVALLISAYSNVYDLIPMQNFFKV
jgi:Fe-S-cluster containining protein